MSLIFEWEIFKGNAVITFKNIFGAIALCELHRILLLISQHWFR